MQKYTDEVEDKKEKTDNVNEKKKQRIRMNIEQSKYTSQQVI